MKYSILLVALFYCVTLSAQQNKLNIDKNTTEVPKENFTSALENKTVKAKPISENISNDLRSLFYNKKNKLKTTKAKPLTEHIYKDLKSLMFNYNNRTKAIKAKPIAENINRDLKSLYSK